MCWYFDHDLTFGAVEGMRPPICRVQVLNDRSVIAQQTTPHPVLNGEAFMESDTADTGTRRRRYGRVPLDAVGALVFEVWEHSCEFSLFALSVRVHNLYDEFERIYLPDMGEFIQPLPIIESCDNLKHFCFLFRC